MNPNSAVEAAAELTANNELCRFPCFWGFTPGVTTQSELEEFLRTAFPEAEQYVLSPEFLETANQSYEPSALTEADTGYEFFLVIEDEINFGMSTSFREGLLTFTGIGIHEPTSWLPPDTLEPGTLLSTQDAVPKIYIALYDTATLGWGLTVIYNDLGVAAEYTFLFEESHFTRYSDVPIQLCYRMEDSERISLSLQDPNLSTPVEDTINPTAPSGWLEESPGYKSVEFVTGLSTEEFISRMVNDPSGCIEAYSYNDLQARGMDF
jgi:hypothetical protein